MNLDFHFPDHCIVVNDASRCISEHRNHIRRNDVKSNVEHRIRKTGKMSNAKHRIRRNDVTPNAPAVLYLPLGGSTSQGCPSTAESSVVGISQVCLSLCPYVLLSFCPFIQLLVSLSVCPYVRISIQTLICRSFLSM